MENFGVTDQGEEEAFKRFDVVSDVSDHYYRSSNKSGKETQCFTSGAVNKSIMKEWKILERDLPDTIYVRVYEDRIDLVRAVIIGASGTPYHDGLFFFDIVFPSDYPKHPPKVYYHSHGLRLNPNLYASGKVCLSLVNTWTGAKSERWTPTKSSILQLLVSLQGLVLNERPYFNEPGYEAGIHKPSEVKHSLAYNQNSFILSCKTMLYIVRKPPKHFEKFVVEHFRCRGEVILAAIKSYRNCLCAVGEYKRDRGKGPSSSTAVSASAQFKANADKIYSDLEVAFRNMQSYTPPEHAKSASAESGESTASSPSLPSKNSSQLGRKAEASSPLKPQVVVQKPKSGIWKKIVSAFKWIWK